MTRHGLFNVLDYCAALGFNDPPRSVRYGVWRLLDINLLHSVKCNVQFNYYRAFGTKVK